MENGYVFLYAKGKEIKALNLEESLRLSDSLLKDGWNHTQTLDAYTYIQYLHNDCEDEEILNEIKSLSKPLNMNKKSKSITLPTKEKSKAIS
jgi:hypothetical protein